MAGKGTFSAFTGAKPIQEDFGAISERIAQGYVAQKERDVAREAAGLKAQREQERYAKAQYDKTLDRLSKMDEKANQILSVKTAPGFKDPVMLMKKQFEGQYANLRREYKTSDRGRQTEIEYALGNMLNVSNEWTQFSTEMNGFLADASKGIGTTYDDTGNAKFILDLMDSVESGKSVGGIELEDGVAIGNNFAFKVLGNGKAHATLKLGEEEIEGTPSEIIASLKSKLKPMIDLTAELDNWEGSYNESVVTEINNSGDFAEKTITTNLNKAKRYYNDRFDQTVGLEKDKNGNLTGRVADKWIQVTGKTGDEMKKSWVDIKVRALADSIKKSLQNNPNAKAQDKLAKEETLADRIVAFDAGNPKAVGELLANTPWRDPGASGLTNPTFSSMKKYGNSVVIQVTGNKGKAKNLFYSLDDDKERRNLNNIVGSAIGKDLGVADADIQNVNALVDEKLKTLERDEDSVFWIEEQDAVKEGLENIKREDDLTSKNIRSAMVPIEAVLRGKGYKVEYNGNKIFKVLDSEGTTVLNVDTYTAKGFKSDLNKGINKLLGIPQATKEEIKKVDPVKGKENVPSLFQ